MRKSSLYASSLVLAIILGLAVACAKKPDDAQISSDIQSKFSQDSGLSTKHIAVQSSAGVVTLGGSVDNEAQRDAATRQAASVPGVKQVVSNLQVGNATAMSAMTPAPEAMRATDTAKPSTIPPETAKTKTAPSKKPQKARPLADSDYVVNDDPAPSDSGNDSMANNSAAPPPPAMDSKPSVPTPPPPAPKKMIVDQGTQLTIRLVDAIDSEKNQSGDTFHATLNAPLTSDGEEVIPAGSDVVGHITDLKSAGKFAGQSLVALQLDSITSGGKTYNIQTDQYKKEGSSRGKNTAEKVGGGAAIGAIIGAIAGGGKGAAIGAAAGGGVGGGVQAASKSQQIKLPSETVLNFTLQAPVTVIQAPSPNSDRPKLQDDTRP